MFNVAVMWGSAIRMVSITKQGMHTFVSGSASGSNLKGVPVSPPVPNKDGKWAADPLQQKNKSGRCWDCQPLLLTPC